MIKIIFGFLPWIAYSILMDFMKGQHVTAIVIVLLLNFIVEYKELKKGYILPWGTTIFYSLILVATFFISPMWLEVHGSLLANSGIAVIAIVSLIINKPFTLQYARETVPSEYWQTTLFLRINQIITGVWALGFVCNVLLNLWELNTALVNNVFYQVITYLPSILSIYFTKFFPSWYKEYYRNTLIKKSAKQQRDNPFLKGNFAPVIDELFIENLVITGTLPEDLSGIYMRNGPNSAFQPFSYTYPYDGDGMIHAIYLKNGHASYRNRFIETNQLQVERRLKQSIYGGVELPLIRNENLLQELDPKIPVKIGNFIHVIYHAGHYLALHEANPAYEINEELNTVGVWNPTNIADPIVVNAHTRLDPRTGDLILLAYHNEPIITYHVLNKENKITQSETINIPYSCMVHDFVLTENYIVVFLCPMTIDFLGAAKGKHFANWQPELGTKILVIDRASHQTTYLNTEAFFVYHFANGYEIDDKIKIDYIRYEDGSLSSSYLYRTELDLNNKICKHQRLGHFDSEFPRINEAYNSKLYRYIYACGNTSNKTSIERFNAVVKHDLQDGKVMVHDFGNDKEVGEPVFVSREGCLAEDDGYLIFFLYDRKVIESFFIVLDAKNISQAPIAVIKMPRRIPYGLHGSWVSDKSM